MSKAEEKDKILFPVENILWGSARESAITRLLLTT
jgi:hypothetical protein